MEEVMKRMLAAALAVISVATMAPVAQVHTAQAAKADERGESNSRNRRSADVTFIKWLTDLPNAPSAVGAPMVGQVGGDVGAGTFAGLVLTEDTSTPPMWLAQALYGFNGSKHAFVAYNHISENDGATPVTATIRGVVISGWMKGARVTGEYTVMDPCPIDTPKNVFGSSCFVGTLHLRRGHDD
jgi:hypothetical protein